MPHTAGPAGDKWHEVSAQGLPNDEQIPKLCPSFILMGHNIQAKELQRWCSQ
jgi:hypothetical protein